jgi:hypothetical protein
VRKIILSILFIFGFAFIFAGKANAADLTVTCASNGPCTIAPTSTPLFQEANWFPGNTVTRNLTITNQDNTQACDVVMTTSNVTQTPTGFSGELLTNINNGSTNIISGTLNNIFAGPLAFGTINPGSTQNFAWDVTFDQNAGNEFQNSQTMFDFNLNFSCNSTPTPAPSGTGGAVLGASAPTCNSTTPTAAPTLTGTSNSNNSANLVWTPVTPVDHYMIRYGTTAGNYIYGAANVGNVTSFLVQALSGNTTYYFQVAGVNGCAPGPWSNEVAITVGGIVLPVGPAEGFTTQTLGAETAIPSPTTTPLPETLGTSSNCSAIYYYWWIPLIIQLALSFIYIWKRWRDKIWWFVIGFGGILSQIIHQILGCNCATGGLCPWYWLFNLIILFLSVGIFFYRKGRKKEK